ncbi:MAG: HIT domain-containing protein [Candidatus Paceibacterota bacterium]
MPKVGEKKQVDVGNASVVPRDDYVKVLEEIIAAGFCPFCEEHLFKHHPNPVLFQNKHWLVTKNTWPYVGTRLHLLFIARTHIERIEDMTATMLLYRHDLYRQVIEEHTITGATFMTRSGETLFTGATVTHLHSHLIVGGARDETDSKPIKALVGFEK